MRLNQSFVTPIIWVAEEVVKSDLHLRVPTANRTCFHNDLNTSSIQTPAWGAFSIVLEWCKGGMPAASPLSMGEAIIVSVLDIFFPPV